MDNKFVGLLAFTIGAVTGSAVAWYYAKKKYEQIAQEEIDSVKEVFSRREKEKDEPKENLEYKINPTDDVESNHSQCYEDPQLKALREAADTIIRQEGYVTSDDSDTPVSDAPYVIPPEELYEREDYETYTLFYYADGVLTDDNKEIIDDVESTIGFESLNHFGEYEDDSVFVRNDVRGCDYEILRDNRNYSDVIAKKQHRSVDN